MSDIDYDALAASDSRGDDLGPDTRPPAGPYAAAARDYLAAGWKSPLPIPAGKKGPPPTGYTGANGVDPYIADIQTWIDGRGDSNIAIRVPDGVVGIDVDCYAGKAGTSTVEDHKRRWGPLPDTLATTSRDDGSRIRWYRCPLGRWPGELGPGVEIIQHTHRYGMMPPSLHPGDPEKGHPKRPYRWIDESTGEILDGIPRPDDLTVLPERWGVELQKRATEGTVKGDATDDQAKAWLDLLRSGVEPCDKVTQSVRQGIAALNDRDGARHVAMIKTTASLVALGAWGHGGIPEALADLHAAFIDAVCAAGEGQRTDREAAAEWRSALAGAVRMNIERWPTPARQCLCGAELVDVITTARKYQYLPDPTHLLVAMAVAATAEDDGTEPVWLLIVAPPSSGKTEAIRALDGVAVDRLNDVSAAGLLSWKAGKKPKAVGVLTRVEDRPGLVTFGDLSNLLASSDRGGRDATFAMLRRVYDGSVTRDLGNAPEQLKWTGRLTVVAAVTGVIDRYAAHADALGPRWVYVRMPAASRAAKQAASRMARHGGLAEAREGLRSVVTTVVDKAQANLPDTLPDDLEDAIEDAALVVCWGRASVPRHGYGAREIDGLAMIEEPPRVTHQLRGVARGLIAIGLPVEHVPQVIRRVALDSMPEDRRRVLEVLAAGEPLSTSAVARASHLHRKVARFRLEELEVVGVVRCDRSGPEPGEDERDTRPATWRLNGGDGQLCAEVLNVAADEVGWYEMLLATLQTPNKRGEGE